MKCEKDDDCLLTSQCTSENVCKLRGGQACDPQSEANQCQEGFSCLSNAAKNQTLCCKFIDDTIVLIKIR